MAGRKREGQPKRVRGTPAGRFGQHLEQLMVRAGLTTSEFAERIGVTVDVVNLYIKGTRQPPFKNWQTIASVLGLRNLRELVPDFRLK